MNKLLTVEKIVSGGQTGADRGALEFAVESDIPHEGYVPKGRRAEDGQVPEQFKLTETSTVEYRPRTVLNVRLADMTAIFMDSKVKRSRGTATTLTIVQSLKKPHVVLHVDKGVELNAKELVNAISLHRPKSLNVAGHRESHSPGLQSYVRLVLFEAMQAGLDSAPRLEVEDLGPQVQDLD